jgi:hypothetical protein
MALAMTNFQTEYGVDASKEFRPSTTDFTIWWHRIYKFEEAVAECTKYLEALFGIIQLNRKKARLLPKIIISFTHPQVGGLLPTKPARDATLSVCGLRLDLSVRSIDLRAGLFAVLVEFSFRFC